MSASNKYVEWWCPHCNNRQQIAKNLGRPTGMCIKNNGKPHAWKKIREF